LGGSAEKGEWDTTPNPQLAKRILERTEKLLPGISKAKIVTHWVGLRPGRSSIRLEKEVIQNADKKVFVIHNYGHAGSGVTLSWGCAKEVNQIAQSCLASTNKNHSKHKLSNFII